MRGTPSLEKDHLTLSFGVQIIHSLQTDTILSALRSVILTFGPRRLLHLSVAEPPHQAKHTMTFTNVVMAGGVTGTLGKPLLRELLASTAPAFKITVLTTPGSETTKLEFDSRVKVVTVDYYNPETVVKTIKGNDVVVSVLPSRVAQSVDPLLLAACQEAGVRRIFPSQYTLDVMHPAAIKLFTDGWPDAPAVRSAERFLALREEEEKDGAVSFTTIVTSMFLDVFLMGHMNVYEPLERRALVLDGGVHKFTGCSSDFIAGCVIAALRLPEDVTRNKRIPVAELRTTGRMVVEVLEEVWGAEPRFTVTDLPSEVLAQNRQEALAKGDIAGVYRNTVAKLCLDGCGAGDLVEGFEHTQTFDHLIPVPRRTLKEIAMAAKEKLVHEKA